MALTDEQHFRLLERLTGSPHDPWVFTADEKVAVLEALLSRPRMIGELAELEFTNARCERLQRKMEFTSRVQLWAAVTFSAMHAAMFLKSGLPQDALTSVIWAGVVALWGWHDRLRRGRK